MKQAVAFGRQSVEFIDRTDEKDWQMVHRTTLANSLHQTGELSEAYSLFRKAETILRKNRQNDLPILYSVQGFEFCDLLLSQGKVREVLERAGQALKYRKESWYSLLSIALDTLSLGRAYLLQALTPPYILPRGGTKGGVSSQRGKLLEKAADYLDQGAVAGLREAGQQWFLPPGLFARAFFYRVQHDFSNAWGDLAEAQEIAERGSMKLWLVDYHLEAARVISYQLSVNSYQLVVDGREVTLNRDDMVSRLKMHVEQAAKLVKETGYHRRDPEVHLIKAQLNLAKGDKANARKSLAKAKKLFDKMGIRMWDHEVKNIEQKLKKTS